MNPYIKDGLIILGALAVGFGGGWLVKPTKKIIEFKNVEDTALVTQLNSDIAAKRNYIDSLQEEFIRVRGDKKIKYHVKKNNFITLSYDSVGASILSRLSADTSSEW